MLELFSELASLSQALDAAGIRHALAGGLAFCVWVEARNTEDIDILIMPEDSPAVCKALSPKDISDIAQLEKLLIE